jgi:hypothetical protein
VPQKGRGGGPLVSGSQPDCDICSAKKVVTFYEDNILPFLQGSLNIGPRLGKVGDTSF